MAEMSNYCKAYRAEQLREFSGWKERVPPMAVKKEAESNGNSATPAETEESAYFFLHEDFIVTAGVFRDQDIAFDEVTDHWKVFCTNSLKFEPPNPPSAA